MSITTIFFILTSCSSKNKYEIEDSFLECFVDYKNRQGIDISKSIESARSALITHGVVPNTTGKEIMYLLKRIYEVDQLPYNITPELIDALNAIENLPSGIHCFDSSYLEFSDVELNNSKLWMAASILEEAEESAELSFGVVAGELLDLFDEADFDHPFYNTAGILILCNTIKYQESSMKGLL